MRRRTSLLARTRRRAPAGRSLEGPALKLMSTVRSTRPNRQLSLGRPYDEQLPRRRHRAGMTKRWHVLDAGLPRSRHVRARAAVSRSVLDAAAALPTRARRRDSSSARCKWTACVPEPRSVHRSSERRQHDARTAGAPARGIAIAMAGDQGLARRSRPAADAAGSPWKCGAAARAIFGMESPQQVIARRGTRTTPDFSARSRCPARSCLARK